MICRPPAPPMRTMRRGFTWYGKFVNEETAESKARTAQYLKEAEKWRKDLEVYRAQQALGC